MGDKKKFLLYEHGGSFNHGCEAIVRTTINLLNLNKRNACLLSQDAESDRAFDIDKIVKVVEHEKRSLLRESISGYYYRLKSRITNKSYDDYEFEYNHRTLTKQISDIALSIGGDNYCYGSCAHLTDNNNALRKKGVKTVLWGCSLNENCKKSVLQSDLNAFSLITTRETISYEILKKNNIDTQIVLCADPAFTLPTQEIGLPWGANQEVIGLNLSPLISNYEKEIGFIEKNSLELVKFIISELKKKIVLIPHVTNSWTNDYEVLKKIHDMYPEETILIGENFNCCQLKYIISKCDFFIGARTHATIAAYSTRVPTLTLGYSTKAKGIAQDIFGEWDEYVLDVGHFNSAYDLVNKFKRLYLNKSAIRSHLENFMPNYILSAEEGAKAVFAL